MAILLSSERPAVAAAASNPFVTLMAWFAKGRALRAQHEALSHLLQMEPERLDDLGISRDDVLEAMGKSQAGHWLAQQRARLQVSPRIQR